VGVVRAEAMCFASAMGRSRGRRVGLALVACVGVWVGALSGVAPNVASGAAAPRVTPFSVELADAGCEVAAEDSLVAVSDAASVQVLDAVTGERRWGAVRTGPTSVALAKGLVWTIDVSSTGNPVIVRRDARNGRIVGRSRVALREPVLIASTQAVVVFDPSTQGVFGFDLGGKLRWSARALPRRLVGPERLLVESRGQVRVLRTTDGQIEGPDLVANSWNFVDVTRDLYFASDGTILDSVDVLGFAPRWSMPVRPQRVAGVLGSTVIVLGSASAGAGDRSVIGLDVATGDLRWALRGRGDPFIRNDTIYVASSEGVGTVDAKTGALTSFRTVKLPGELANVVDLAVSGNVASACASPAPGRERYFAFGVRRPGS
jgi:outer membrane protein assembly factor BamB